MPSWVPGSIEQSDLVALALLTIAAILCVRLWRRGSIRLAWWVWTLAIVGATVPFGDLHSHTHWSAESWTSFDANELKISDVAANLLLYMPLGLLTPAALRRPAAMKYAAGRAFLLSFLAELSQNFSHSRTPSTTDLICNVIGAAIGVWLKESLPQVH